MDRLSAACGGTVLLSDHGGGMSMSRKADKGSGVAMGTRHVACATIIIVATQRRWHGS